MTVLACMQGEKQGPQRKVTRHMKRRYNEINHIQQGIEDLDPTTQALEREHEKVGRACPGAGLNGIRTRLRARGVRWAPSAPCPSALCPSAPLPPDA